MLSLRPYQREAVQSIYDYFGKEKGNPLVVLPTGSGKSLVMADFIKGVMSADPNHRILVVTHVKELIQQNFQELLSIWPEAPAGVYSAGLNSRNTHARVLFCGIQSIHNKVKQLEWAHLIIIDEAHLLPNSANTRYRNFINDMLRYNPRMKVIGLTATPYRLGTGSLHKGKDALFTDICHDTSVLDLIDQGYLAPLITKKTEAQIDVSDVHKRGGEFIEKELQAAVNKEAITKAAIKEVIDYGKSRRSWIVFASGVDHAKNINEEIASYGIKTACILGSTPKAERDRLIQAYKRFDLQCLVSMGVLTTGFNAPSVDLIANLRPTQSAGLYVQMCGRGMRKAPGKRNCIVLDFAGNIERHGPIDAVTIEDRKSDEPGEAPVKACPECGSFVKIQDMQCPDCGFEFPPPEPEEKIPKSQQARRIF